MARKDLQHYKALPYRVDLYFDQEDQVWIARYPELPGCIAHGATKEEALAAGEEMKSLWLETALTHHDTIAEPQPEPSYSGKLVLRLPKTLHERAAQAASQEGVSLNTYLVQLISEGTMLSGVASFGRLVSGYLQKALRRLNLSSKPSAIKVMVDLAVEPIYGQDKDPLPAVELERLASEPPESVRENHAK